MTSGKLYFRRFLKEILLKDRFSRTVSGSEVCEPHAFWKSRDRSSCHYCSLCPNEVGCVFLYDCFQNVNTLGLELADTVSEITAVRLGQFLK